MSHVKINPNQSLVISKELILKGIVVLWGIIILFLVLADIFINHYEWVDSGAMQRLVNITRDDGLPNWFSSIQLLSIGVVLWCLVFSYKYSTPTLIKNKKNIWGWAVIALFFTYLAIDDGSKMHERVGTAFRDSIEARHEYNPSVISNLLDVFPSYGWQFLFVPIFSLVALFILIFLYKNLKNRTQIIFIVMGFACYASSVGLDFVEGMDEEVYDPLIAFFNTELHPIQHFSKLIEETFEMLGNTFFMLAFTKQLLNLSEEWNIKLVNTFNKKSD